MPPSPLVVQSRGQPRVNLSFCAREQNDLGVAIFFGDENMGENMGNSMCFPKIVVNSCVFDRLPVLLTD